MRVCAILDVNSVSFVIFLLAECNKIKSCSTTPVIDAIVAVYVPVPAGNSAAYFVLMWLGIELPTS